MSGFTILVVLVSSLFHVSWNMIGKKNSPSGAFFFLTALFAVLLFSPVYMLLARYKLFSLKALFYPAVAGVFQTIYYIGLGKGYKYGDMSYIYPIARALPVLFVMILAIVFRTGGDVQFFSFLGILMVFAGCLILPLDGLDKNWIKRYFSKSSLFALMAAVGTTGYSIVDSQGMYHFFKVITESRLKITVSPAVVIPAVYIACEMLSAAVFLGIYILISGKERESLLILLKSGKKHTAAAGMLIVSAYILILWAYTQVSNVSYVTAFRQISIPLGTAGGFILLKEKETRGKIAGSAIIFTGLVLVAVGS